MWHVVTKKVKTYCGGKKRQGEGTCTRPPGWGTTHAGIGACKLHGGSTPNAVIHAQRVVAQRTIDAAYVNAYGRPRFIDPAEGLIEEYWRSAGIVAGLETRVAEIPADDLVWGVTESTNFAGGEDDEGRPSGPIVKSKAAPNIWLRLFNEERDRFAKLGLEIARLGLEARRDEYIRAQVDAFAAVLLHADLGLSERQRATAARLLRSLEAVEGTVVS